MDARSQQMIDKDKLKSDADRVSVSVRAKGMQADSLTLKLTIKDPSISLTRIELLNGAGNNFGSSECKVVGEFEYTANVDVNTIRNWFHSGESIQSTYSDIGKKQLHIRVGMMMKSVEVYRSVPIVLSSGLVGTPHGNQNEWTVEGDI